MTRLFGLDIAKLVNDNIAAAGGVLSGELTRETNGTRTSSDLAAGPNITSSTFSFKGFTETREVRGAGSTVASGMATVSILGDSISTTPRVNDEVTLSGRTWTLVELLERDPASALYTFRATER